MIENDVEYEKILNAIDTLIETGEDSKQLSELINDVARYRGEDTGVTETSTIKPSWRW